MITKGDTLGCYRCTTVHQLSARRDDSCGAANHGCRRPLGGALFSALPPVGGGSPRPPRAATILVGQPIMAAAAFQAALCLRLAAMWGRTPPVLRPTSTSARARYDITDSAARRAGPGGPAQTWRSAPRLDSRFFNSF